jgi:hypothetical protein
MSKLSDDEQLVKLILIQAKIMPYWSQDDDDNMKKLLSRLERGRNAMEAMEKIKSIIDEQDAYATDKYIAVREINNDYQQSEEAEG